MKQEGPRRRRHVARQWHRWLGLIASLPLLWLAISGVLLNHAESLGLNDRMVSTGWILRHYNQLPEGEPLALNVGDRKVVEWDGYLFLDSKPLTLQGRLVGAEALKGQLVIALDEVIGIYDGSNELVLELDELSLPEVPVEAIDFIENRLLVKVGSGWYQLSEDFFTSEESTEEGIPDRPEKLAGEDLETLSEAIRTRRSMPLSRVILDAHSGSLFGWPGWLITDLSAVSLIVLTLLGLRLFPKRRS